MSKPGSLNKHTRKTIYRGDIQLYFLTSFVSWSPSRAQHVGRDDWLGLFSLGLSPRQVCRACLGALRAIGAAVDGKQTRIAGERFG